MGITSDRPLAIVTGAAAGIGLEVARALANRGTRLVLIDRDEPALRAVVDRLSAVVSCSPILLDLADAGGLDRAAESIHQRHGPADVLVNNAGVGCYRRFLDHTPEDHAQLMAVNYDAPVRLIRAVLPGMLQRRRGHIINITSMVVKAGACGHAAYSASKSALRALTFCLEGEYGPAGVRFSCVHPGIVRTRYFVSGGFDGLFDRLRWYAVPPRRIAERTVALLDRPRLEVCVPWWYRILDVIMAASPRAGQRLVAWHSRDPDWDRPCTAPPGAVIPPVVTRAADPVESPVHVR